MGHEENILNILSRFTDNNTLKHRESITLEYKQSFSEYKISKYAKTMAAFANNRGGYIIFGVQDKPRIIVGLINDNFDNFSQEKMSDKLNSLFAPEINWECGSVIIKNSNAEDKIIGWIYTDEAEQKPVIAQKADDKEKISAGDIFYRYRGRSEKIKYSEMNSIIEKRISKERENLFKLFEMIRKNNTFNLGIVNYSNGRLTTPYGVDVSFDRKLVTQVLKKAKYIKEGSFNETNGNPVIKVTGNIDLAEEVPVPDANPNDTHPYIQSQLAEKLGIRMYDLQVLIWYYRMKEANKYHLEITTSRSTTTHKFSEFAFQFLKEKLNEFSNNPKELDRIRKKYNNRNK